jgi:hypothetical protein
MVRALRYTRFPLRDLARDSLEAARIGYYFMAKDLLCAAASYADGRGRNAEPKD